MIDTDVPLALAHRVAESFSLLPQVEAIALGGSQVSTPDASSDIDLYVLTRDEIALTERRRVVQQSGGAARASLGLTFWGPGDEWFDAVTGIEVDIVYFDAQWLADELDRVLQRQQPALGYTTCLWHTVCNAQSLYDPNGWFAALQSAARQPYPERLRHNIVAFNYPVLRSVIPAYTTQLQKAVKRNDLVSVNHRLAALLASYFDVIFAVNRLTHPGEKRLLAQALSRCTSLPAHMAMDVENTLRAAAAPDVLLMTQITRLLDHLDEWLGAEGFVLQQEQGALSEP